MHRMPASHKRKASPTLAPPAAGGGAARVAVYLSTADAERGGDGRQAQVDIPACVKLLARSAHGRLVLTNGLRLGRTHTHHTLLPEVEMVQRAACHPPATTPAPAPKKARSAYVHFKMLLAESSGQKVGSTSKQARQGWANVTNKSLPPDFHNPAGSGQVADVAHVLYPAYQMRMKAEAAEMAENEQCATDMAAWAEGWAPRGFV